MMTPNFRHAHGSVFAITVAAVLSTAVATADSDNSEPFHRVTFSSPTGLSTQPTSVNSSNHVVGYYQEETGGTSFTQPFMWTPRTGLRTLQNLDSGGINSINECGEMVGNVRRGLETDSVDYAAKWTPGGHLQLLEDLTVTPLHGLRLIAAQDINERGHIVGLAQRDAPLEQLGFWWSQDEGVKIIPPFQAGGAMVPLALNNNDEVVGIYFSPPDASGQIVQRAFMWSARRGARDLGPASSQSVEAHDINDAGQIAGIFRDSDGVPHGVEWTTAGGLFPLVSGASAEVNAINTHGLIVGDGAMQRSVLAWSAPNRLHIVDETTEPVLVAGVSDTTVITGLLIVDTRFDGAVWFPRHPSEVSQLKKSLCARRHLP